VSHPVAVRDLPARARTAGSGDVYINGRFFGQRESGVQRFARQLVLALDAELARDGDRRWFLLLPPGTARVPTLRRIEVRVVGRARGHLWDQLLRFHCGQNDILVNLANSGTVFRARSITILHDAAVFRTPRNFSLVYGTFHRWLGRLIALRSTIGTVSHFSRAELSDTLGLAAERIFVVPNGCEHLRDVVPDPTVLPRLGLRTARYFLAIGSPVANKNLRAAIEAYARLDLPEQRFVIVGAVDRAVFGRGLSDAPPGVVLAGALPDAALVALLKNANALVFPSLYEGFGIPPLEAMLNGCPVIASEIPPVVEVCGDAALYFDPGNVDSMTHALRRVLADSELGPELLRRGAARAALYSWRRSAQSLMEAIGRLP
jgi:glycosyltransferase involved in cell wall biosynthesis